MSTIYYIRTQQSRLYNGKVSVTGGIGKAELLKSTSTRIPQPGDYVLYDTRPESVSDVKQLRCDVQKNACWWEVKLSGNKWFKATVTGEYWR